MIIPQIKNYDDVLETVLWKLENVHVVLLMVGKNVLLQVEQRLHHRKVILAK
jgi:hypothetical protein